jgi:hypothetical protein
MRDMKLFKPRFNQRHGTPDASLTPNPVRHYAACDCLTPQYEESGRWQELALHSEIQNTNCDAWKSLETYVQKVDADGNDEFNPIVGIGYEQWQQIITLPRSIGSLKSVKVLNLYGSHLVRIPPEIGEMTRLEEFDPYTSYCLHWLPYEITRCKKLRRSRVSTRALYGNYKHRAPFPRLPSTLPEIAPASCSVCEGPFTDYGPYQVWISLWVATDVLPLLVHACSSECARNLPKPAPGYVSDAHHGGLEVRQPPTSFGLPG